MVATRILGTHEFAQYKNWLREQSVETLAMYFGVVVGDAYIDNLMEKILTDPDKHDFLVASIGNKWIGVIHMARVTNNDMEFGIIIHPDLRGNGYASELITEAIIWIRNRGYDHLYLHCLNRNSAMKHLARKHGLVLHEEGGDVDACAILPPPSVISYTQEALNLQKNIFFLNLDRVMNPFGKNHNYSWQNTID